MKVGIIAAFSPEGVIGLHGKIPWRYPGDFRRFKRVTMGSTIIMGRLTWESIGKPLPGRRNIVVTSGAIPNVEHYPTLPEALMGGGLVGPQTWLIGGARIYEEGMYYADLLDITYVPDSVEHPEAVHFPAIDHNVWQPGAPLPHEDEPTLHRQEFRRR